MTITFFGFGKTLRCVTIRGDAELFLHSGRAGRTKMFQFVRGQNMEKALRTEKLATQATMTRALDRRGVWEKSSVLTCSEVPSVEDLVTST